MKRQPRNPQATRFSTCELRNFQASLHAIEAQADSVPLPGWDDRWAMRGGLGHAQRPQQARFCLLRARARCNPDLIRASTSVALGIAACSVAATVEADWILRGFVRTYSRAERLGRVPPSPHLQKRATAQHASSTPLLWAERGKPRVRRRTLRLCLWAARGGWPRAAKL